VSLFPALEGQHALLGRQRHLVGRKAGARRRSGSGSHPEAGEECALAWIEHGGDKIAGTVRDLSLTGASLEVSDPNSVPQKFTLGIPEDGLKMACRVVRRTEFRMGIIFE
jgi:hypothetical protein